MPFDVGPELTDAWHARGRGQERSRRGLLAAVAGGGAIAGGGAVFGTLATARQASAASAHNIRYVGAGDTIQDAVDSVGSFGEIVVTPGYDSDAENFPITVRERVHIRGDHGTRIRNNQSANTFDIRIGSVRPPGVVLENLHIMGGRDGINSYNSRYCILQNIHIEQPGRDGVRFTQNTRESGHSSNTHRLFGVSIEQAGRHGFLIGQATHAVDMISCEAQFCGNDGLHVQSAFTTTVVGGVYQYNGDKGIHANGSNALAVYNAYLEGNDTGSHYNELVLRSVAGAVIDGCYFNGTGQNQNGIFLTGSAYVDIRAATYRGMTNALVDIQGGSYDIDLHRGTHFDISGSGLIESTDGVRIRSNGVIGGATGGVDLRSTEGQWVGDTALSDGGGAKAGLLATWTGSSWQPSDGSGRV